MEVVDLQFSNTHSPIVVVDDSEMSSTITKRVYERSKLKNPLLEFKSGAEFLRYMQEVKDGTQAPPAIVFIDIHMPDMDGFETLANLRDETPFKESPKVVMLTSSDDDDDAARAFNLGANGFQTKPQYPNELLDFFNSLVPAK